MYNACDKRVSSPLCKPCIKSCAIFSPLDCDLLGVLVSESKLKFSNLSLRGNCEPAPDLLRLSAGVFDIGSPLKN